jgi:hypothetical protein
MIQTDYFNWLYDQTKDRNHRRGYDKLLKQLHSKPFKWYVPNDHNRAFEGRQLRDVFCREYDIYLRAELDSAEVSMLELTVSLAMRCESMMTDIDNNLTLSEWFWMLLNNVELDKFINTSYYNYGGEEKVDQILNIIIDRKYTRLGKGGLFPLKNAKKDQRKVELWYQMCYFLVEKFNINDMNF